MRSPRAALQRPRPLSRAVFGILLLLYGCAALQFTRFYVKRTIPYLNMPAYLSGHERLPFQERVLPIVFLRPLSHSAWVAHAFAHGGGLFTADQGPFFILSLVSFLVAAVYLQALYRRLTISGLLAPLVFPLFLFMVMWSYSIHLEADYSYPYDLPSLAFFTAGLYYIYRRSFIGVLLVILIGTFNRETTLFLVGLYAIDGATRTQSSTPSADPWTFQLNRIHWPRLLLLTAIWCLVKLSLAHHFAANDASENISRVATNLAGLRLRLLPALLNLCGYSLPLAILFQRSIHPRRFAYYLLIVIPWIAAAFYGGILLETRIYGELCSISALSLVLILEHRASALPYTAASSTSEVVAVVS